VLDDRSLTYYRTYTNILNIFGDIGGMTSFLLTVGTILLTPITTMLLETNIANQIFSFDNQVEE